MVFSVKACLKGVIRSGKNLEAIVFLVKIELKYMQCSYIL